MPEDGTDPLRPPGEPAHATAYRPLEPLFAARRRLARDRLLQVGVHALVRIQFRTVRWQVDDLDLGPVLGQPPANGTIGLAPDRVPSKSRRCPRPFPAPPATAPRVGGRSCQAADDRTRWRAKDARLRLAAFCLEHSLIGPHRVVRGECY